MTNHIPPVCDYEGSDYQQVFWENGDRAYEDAAEAIALKHLLPQQGARLLEIGAGAGRNTPRYKKYPEITLLDFSITQLQQAREQLGENQRYRYVAANVYQLPFPPGMFDAVTMIRTLHHLVDSELALAQIRAVLQNQGLFILEYANKRNLKAILRYLLRKQSWNPFSPEPVEFVKLNFNFHPSTVCRWLHTYDFHILEQRTVSHFRVGFLKKILPHQWLAAVDSLLQPTGNILQYSPSVFVKAIAKGQKQGALPPFAFKCPACGFAPLPEPSPKITCPQCRKTYTVKDGIYDFRVNQN